MPLKSGSSDATVSYNIKELLQAKYPKAQAVAISLSKAGKGRIKRKKKSDGGVQKKEA